MALTVILITMPHRGQLSYIGKKGLALKAIARYDEGKPDGKVRVFHAPGRYEDWRARSDEDIPEGEEVEVVEISKYFLTDKKYKGGN